MSIVPGMNEFMNAYSATSSNKLPYSREFDSEDTNLLNRKHI